MDRADFNAIASRMLRIQRRANNRGRPLEAKPRLHTLATDPQSVIELPSERCRRDREEQRRRKEEATVRHAEATARETAQRAEQVRQQWHRERQEAMEWARKEVAARKAFEREKQYHLEQLQQRMRQRSAVDVLRQFAGSDEPVSNLTAMLSTMPVFTATIAKPFGGPPFPNAKNGAEIRERIARAG